ncbi:MAG: FapA family protein [Deltaproteobacteria bacterium]|nr:FapA family protein [Deltaproteobacteria bacterium]
MSCPDNPCAQSQSASLLVVVTPDKSEVRVVDYAPPTGDGAPLNATVIKEALFAAGVRVAADPEAVALALELISQERSPAGIVLARATPPKDGADGTIHFRIRTAAEIGTLTEGDQVDYHERGIVEPVTAGQVIAMVTPPTGGTSGMDVTGGVIPSRRGRAADLKAGPGVSISEDGTCFSAATTGVVLHAKGVLSVTDSFEVAGDVDLSTGNIRMGHGSVLVRGVLRSGFEVTASGNVVVEEEVEEALIEAGGDVDVRRGVLGGRLKATGSICAQFATSAQLEAGGDISVAGYLYHCRATAGGKIVASSGKGVIRGGTLRCSGGLEVNELGSRGGTTTEIIVDVEDEAEFTLEKELREVEEAIELVFRYLGSEERIMNAPPDGERVQENLRTLFGQKAEISQRLSDIRKEKQRQSSARVTVKRITYPGVVIFIAGRKFEVVSDTPRCVFCYDLETDAVATKPL